MENIQADYALLDCGDGMKLERFAGVTVCRPAPGALGRPRLAGEIWRRADLSFSKETGWRGDAPTDWRLRFGETVLLLRPAAGGQLGVFPEHLPVADWIKEKISAAPYREKIEKNGVFRILNLFAHTGLASLRLITLPKTEIIHLDAAAAAVRWARENAAASGLGDRPIRWITDDALGFMRRERRRDKRYDLILADPPAFGRGKKGEWKLERDLPELCALAGELLMPGPAGFVLTCHREGLNREEAEVEMRGRLPGFSKVESRDLRLTGVDGKVTLPAGCAVFAERFYSKICDSRTR